MLLSAKRWLCRLDYLLALAAHSKKVSEDRIQKIQAQIKEDVVPITPKLTFNLEKNEAHLYIYGPLISSPDPYIVLYSRYYTTYQSIQLDLEKVQEEGSIEKLYLHINSPGGEVEGLDDTWRELINIRENIEIIAVNEGDIASAAYWLASAAHKIIATSETDQQGSIGVIAGYIDWSEYDKKEGINEKIFVSKNAKYKHPVQTGYDEKLQKTLDDLETIFVSRISEGRGLTTEHIYSMFGEGSMLLASEAKSVGMIDDIVFKSDLFSSGKDEPGAAVINSNKGDIVTMTLEEMLNDPGVQAAIAQQVAAARSEGRKVLLEDIKGVMPFLNSDSYSQKVKENAIAVLEGKKSKEAFDAIVEYEDELKALAEAEKAESDSDNKQPLSGQKPNFTGSDNRSVEDRVKAIRKLQGKE